MCRWYHLSIGSPGLVGPLLRVDASVAPGERVVDVTRFYKVEMLHDGSTYRLSDEDEDVSDISFRIEGDEDLRLVSSREVYIKEVRQQNVPHFTQRAFEYRSMKDRLVCL